MLKSFSETRGRERAERVTLSDFLTEFQNPLSNRMGLMCTRWDLSVNERNDFQIMETVKH